MKNKLWQTDNNLNPLVEDYTVGDDYIFDQQLLPYDIEASLAHAKMLFSIKTLTQAELDFAEKGLKKILEKWSNNEFIIQPGQEDGHTAIEQYLTENYGEVGKKIHTGRSRNDQSLVMIRLFMKEKLQTILKLSKTLIDQIENKVKEIGSVPMPGYTHMQKAMPTTVGIWLDSFASALKDTEILLEGAKRVIDQNPLGSASGFGISNFSLDRELTTKNLKFSKTQENPMYCGLSRGFFENIVLQALSSQMIVFGKFATDMLLFTTLEFNFFALPNSFTTGSSIMPQKRNYDLFEIMRGNVKIFTSYQLEIQNIIGSIGSGYQRDLQLTKKPFIEGVNLYEKTLALLIEVVSSLQVNKDQLQKAMTKDLFATNDVYELVNSGKSFREAYIEIKKTLNLE